MKIKKFLSVVLSATMAASCIMNMGILNVSAMNGDNTAPLAPDNMKIELLEQAYGIGTKNPSFSWAVNDPDQNEMQTAYRIVISDTLEQAKSSNYLHDTGWISSDQNTYVKLDGLEEKLTDNELYYWQVQTKDKAGAESPLSEPIAFTTAVGDQWTSINGIWKKPYTAPDIYTEKGWTNYTVEQEVTITSEMMGLVFRSPDPNNCYAWCFHVGDNALRVRYAKNSSSNLTQIEAVGLSDKGITLKENQAFKVKITVKDNTVTTWLDMTNTGDNYIQVDERDMSQQGYLGGAIGYRTGAGDAGLIDDVKVTAEDGTILYQSNFEGENAVSYFKNCTVENGKLVVPRNINVCRMSGLYGESLADGSERGTFLFFRSPKLNLDRDQVEKVVLNATVRGTESTKSQSVDLYVNGESVGVGPAREFNNARKEDGSKYTQAFYNTYDITDNIKNGDNVISAVAYNRDTNNRAFLAQATVFYKDGTKEVLTNSATDGWKVLDGTAAFGDTGREIGTGEFKMPTEDINANYYPYGWQEINYDDSNWSTTLDKGPITDENSRILTPYSAENTLRFVTDEPTKKIERREDGTWFIDLGKEIIGGLKVNLTSPKEQQVTVYAGEQLNDDGTVRHKLAAGPDYTDHWTLKEGEQSFETITMKNFRYVEIVGFEGTIEEDDIMGWAMHQEFDEEDSDFVSSNDLLNREYDMSKYTMKMTNQDLYTDSQARERKAYEGDLLVNSNTSYAVQDNYSLARYSNEYLFYNQTWPEDYKLFSVEMAWQDYLYTGNADSLKENYETLKTKLLRGSGGKDNYVEEVGLVTGCGLIDWPTGERDGYKESTYNTPFNAEYVGIYELMAKIAHVIGNTEDENLYRQRSETIKKSMIEKLYDRENGKFYDSMNSAGVVNEHSALHSSAYALAYGVYDSPEMAKRLAEFVGNNGEFKGSIYATYFILRGLFQSGNGEEAISLLTNPDTTKDAKTFAAVMDTLKATISPEAWSNKHKSNLTLSHPWGASPGCSIVQGMFGILPTTPGFETFNITFQPGGIDSASVKTPSIRGEIQASYQNGDTDDMTASVTIPVNTTAKVSMPVNNKSYGKLIVDGKTVDATREGKFLSVQLGSGTHSIAISTEEVPSVPVVYVSAYVPGGNSIDLNETDKRLEATISDQFGDIIPNSDVQLSFQSSDESVATIAQDGTLSLLRPGNTTITVTATYQGQTGTTSVVITVIGEEPVPADQIKDIVIELDIDQYGKQLEVGESTQANLVAIYGDNSRKQLDNIIYTVKEGDAITVDQNGIVTGAKALEQSVLNALVSGVYGELSTRFDATRIQILDPYYNNSFDDPNDQTMPGLIVSNGGVQMAKNQKIISPVGFDWAENDSIVYKGEFIIQSKAASFAFNAKDDKNFYFWQFRSDNSTLKKHTNINGQFDNFETVPLTNLKPDGESNSFMIISSNNEIRTYLNGELVDVTEANTSLPMAGSFGCRNGSSEAWILNDISVGNDVAVSTDRMIQVMEEVQVDDTDIVDVSIELALDGQDKQLVPGEATTAKLIGTRKNGEKVELSNVTYTVKEGDAITVDENGTVTGVKPLEQAVLNATSSDKLAELAPNFDLSSMAVTPVYTNTFDDKNDQTLPGLKISNGSAYAGKSQVVISNVGSDWISNSNTVYSGKFTIENNAGNIAFCAADSKNFYFWQFRSDKNTLKKHTSIDGKVSNFNTIQLSNLKPAGQQNTFQIAIVDGQILTYLNGVLVDITPINNNLPTGGGFGVRNGQSESFYLDEISVGKDFALSIDRTITVGESAVVDSDKTILNKVITYAEEQKAADDFNNVIAYVQESFNAALDAAKEIAADPAATQDAVDAAWKALMTEIHKLGFVKGDITSLEALVSLAEGYDMNDYVEAGQAEFLESLKAAQDLLADKDNAMQAEIETAESNLLNAMLNLRYKADKSILEKVIAEANGKDANAYTAESYAVLEAAVAEANAVMANEDATQEEVDAAVTSVQEAMKGLVAVEKPSTETPDDNKADSTQTGQESTTTKANAAKTGDVTPIAGLATIALAGVAILLTQKKK